MYNNMFNANAGVICALMSEVTIEQRRECRKHMNAAFVKLLAIEAKNNVYWTGTQTDLVELAYHAYVDGVVRDTTGRPLPFKQLAAMVCAKLHVVMPCNVYKSAAAAIHRKGMRCPTMEERYCWMRLFAHIDEPLMQDLRFIG